MYIVKDTYDSSSQFMFINGKWDSINDAFIDYIDKGLELVEQKEKQFVEALKNKFKDNPDYVDDLETEEKINIHYLKTTFLNAGLMYIFSQFECYLGYIKESTRNLYGDTIESIKFSSNIIDNHKIEIIKMASIDEEFESQFKIKWDKILDYQKIRNIIVHANGTTQKMNIAIRFKRNYPTLRIIDQINNTYDLYLSRELILEIVKEMTLFLKKLMEFLYETNKKRKNTVTNTP